MVNVVDVGIVVTWNLLSLKFATTKLELVIDEKLSNNIISPLFILCADAKVIVTAVDPLVVEKADVKVVSLWSDVYHKRYPQNKRIEFCLCQAQRI